MRDKNHCPLQLIKNKYSLLILCDLKTTHLKLNQEIP